MGQSRRNDFVYLVDSLYFRLNCLYVGGERFVDLRLFSNFGEDFATSFFSLLRSLHGFVVNLVCCLLYSGCAVCGVGLALRSELADCLVQVPDLRVQPAVFRGGDSVFAAHLAQLLFDVVDFVAHAFCKRTHDIVTHCVSSGFAQKTGRMLMLKPGSGNGV